jgi:hypothetical protein
MTAGETEGGLGRVARFRGGASLQAAYKILATGLTLGQITALTLGVAGIWYILSLFY